MEAIVPDAPPMRPELRRLDAQAVTRNLGIVLASALGVAACERSAQGDLGTAPPSPGEGAAGLVEPVDPPGGKGIEPAYESVGPGDLPRRDTPSQEISPPPAP